MNDASENLLNRIYNNYNGMSKSHKRIADFILEAPNKVSFMTASAISQSVGISESTVVRFASSLGYKGYPSLLKAMQEAVISRLTTTERFEMSKDLDSESSIVKSVMDSDIKNIRHTADQLDAKTLKSVVSEIKKSRKIYILGQRSSKILAEYCDFYLNFLFDDVHLLASSANDLFDELINIGEKDVLLVFSFPRYANRTFEAVEFAKKQCATILGITDSHTSPLVSYCKYVLTARYNMTTFIDSLVAPISLINTLIIALTVGERSKIKKKFDLLEEVWSLNDIYRKK